MHVAESGSDGEARADRVQLVIDVEDVLRLGVKAGFVHAGVVHAVFFAAGDANLDFERHADFAHALQVFAADGHVFFDWFFGEVDHVRGEQRFAGFGEVFFAGI